MVMGCEEPATSDPGPDADASPPPDAVVDEVDAQADKDGGADAAADAQVDAQEPCAFDEECDDGNGCTVNECDPVLGCQHPSRVNGTACAIGECQGGVCVEVADDSRTLFRMDTVVLTDPHVVADQIIHTPVFFEDCLLCEDITNEGETVECVGEMVALAGLNPALDDLISQDGTGDGYIDLSFVLVYELLDQTDGGGGLLTVTEGLCDEADPTTCVPDPDASNTETTTYSSQTSGECLSAIPGTLGPRPYPDGITIEPNDPSGDCFVSDAMQVTISVAFEMGGTAEQVNIPMQEAQVAGEWQGDPATSITNGLLRGFLSMQDADQENITLDIEMVGEVNINLGRDLLPDDGTAHACHEVSRAFPPEETTGSNEHCEGGDARDLQNPDGGASYTNCGWWFYINWTGDWITNASGF
jgi:hypothetical protein